jgi:hypothetical protein
MDDAFDGCTRGPEVRNVLEARSRSVTFVDFCSWRGYGRAARKSCDKDAAAALLGSSRFRAFQRGLRGRRTPDGGVVSGNRSPPGCGSQFNRRAEMRPRRFRVLLVTGALCLLAGMSGAAQGAPPLKSPIAWTPATVELTVARGNATATSVSFTADKKQSNVTVAAGGGVSAFVTPSPASFASVAAATPVAVNLAVSVPAGTALGNYTGTVQVVANRKVLASALPVTIHVVAPAGHIYWANGSIGRADRDGSNPDGAFIPISSTGGATGVAVDAQHIYWTNSASIGRANLDGSNPNPTFIVLPGGGIAPPQAVGIAVDAQHIYWADPDFPAIGRANLDGTNVEPSYIPLSEPALPYGVAVDANHIYWADQCRVANLTQCVSSAIGRANLDGTSPNRDFIPSLGGLGVTGIAVDAQHVFWGNTDYNGGLFTGEIGRANLDGSSPNPTLITRDIGGAVVGVAVDTNYVYWGNPVGIGRASLDGSNPDWGFTGTGSATFVAVGD